MGLEWIVLAAAVAVEVVLLFVVTLPLPSGVAKSTVNVYKRILHPLLAVLPFAIFQLLDIYWKYEHRVKCTSQQCTTMEIDRFEKSTFKGQRNGILSIAAILCYWVLYRYVHHVAEVNRLETQVKSVVKTE